MIVWLITIVLIRLVIGALIDKSKNTTLMHIKTENCSHVRVCKQYSSVFFQIKFEDESVLGVRREDVYIDGVDLPAKVRQKMVGKTEENESNNKHTDRLTNKQAY